MNFVVFDLEWNCAGKANKVERAIQEAIPFEIIEIGAVKLDEQFQVVGKFNTQIRPRIYPILTGPVAAVTRRHQQSMKYGLDFKDAARDFMSFCGNDPTYCTWSESDTATLLMNMRHYGILEQLPGCCVDVQHLFDAVIEQADIQRSIEYAVDFLKLPKNQPFHQAVSDAWYTGQILRSIAEATQHEYSHADLIARFAFDPNVNRTSQYTLEGLDSLAAALTRVFSQPALCPACSAVLQVEQAWAEAGHKLVAVFSCPDHGRVTGKCRLRRKRPNQLTAYVTIRLDRDQGISPPASGIEQQAGPEAGCLADASPVTG